ncbi:hypothetical protein NQ317_017443 [Molorchus minor]|uniref:Uncharacterized protein n=1 Tax=Molorchus minor TaxID=1323400 RepID=A0ABQ9J9J5_9CUCU|nr:hypothetical protein NQ317_017443 [Molorchus minor]
MPQHAFDVSDIVSKRTAKSAVFLGSKSSLLKKVDIYWKLQTSMLEVPPNQAAIIFLGIPSDPGVLLLLQAFSTSYILEVVIGLSSTGWLT